MRKVTSGKGVDTTNTVLALLGGGHQFNLATLYLIGNQEDPEAYWITDWDTPLTWSWQGTFQPGVIKRGAVTSKIGLEVQKLDVTWSPPALANVNNIATTSPYQKAWLGRFDGALFQSWTVYMNIPGDADSLGASELFGGRIGSATVERGAIKFTVNSFLDVVNQLVPGSVIETLNTIAGFKGSTPPAGLSVIPTFSVVSANNKVITATCTNPSGHTFSMNAFQYGFMQFTSGSLVKMFSAIETNSVVGGQNQFQVTTPFPWPPSNGDQFYVSATFPINQADGQYYGFPYVPDPNSAI